MAILKKIKVKLPRNAAAAVLGRGLFKNKRQVPKTVYERKPKHTNLPH